LHLSQKHWQTRWLTRGRSDKLALLADIEIAASYYCQFPMHVCFSAMSASHPAMWHRPTWFSQFHLHF